MNHESFSEEELELIMLRLIVIGNINNIKLFSFSINEEKRIQILKALISSQPPPIYTPTKLAPTPLNIKWIASRLLLSEGRKDFPSLNYNGLALNDFSNMNDAATQFFKFSLSRVENRPPDESKIISFAESLLQYFPKHVTISECLLKIYTDYIIQVPLNKLFRNFQFRCFLLINNLDKIDLNTIDIKFINFNEIQPLTDLFLIYNGYKKEDFFPTFQEMIIKENLFPKTIGNDQEQYLRSLINTSLHTKIHFSDVLKNYSYSLFKEGKIDQSIEKAKLIKGIGPWILISHHYSSIKELSPSSLPISINDSVHFFQNMSYAPFEDSENSTAADFLNRLQNDNSFFSMIRQNTGQTIDATYLIDHSIPFFLILFLKHTDPLPFKDLNEKPLFCINDKDRHADADFVWAYFAEVIAINALDKPDQAEDMIAQTSWYLSQISDTKTHHNVLIDIFSIMFLQKEVETKNNEKNLKFVCLQSVAEIILTMILGDSEDKSLMHQAHNGHVLIQYARSISSGVDFEDLFFPKEQQLLKAFVNEDWLIADNIAALNSHLSELNNLYKTVNEYLKKSKFHDLLLSSNKNIDSFVSFHFDPTKSKSKYAPIEIGLSFPDQLEALKAALTVTPISSDALELINKRINKLNSRNEGKSKKRANNYISLLRAVKTLNHVDFTIINQNFFNLNATEWSFSSLSKESDENNKLNLLGSFLFYLDSLIGIVLNKEKLVNNVSEALKNDPSLFVNQLFNKGSIGSAEEVSKIIKRDLMLMVVTENSASEEVIKQVIVENLPLALALALCKEDGMKTNPVYNENSIAFKIANLALKSNENREKQINILLGRNKSSDTFNEEQKLKELKEIIENDKLDIEKVTDISYCLNENQFSNFVLQYININNDYLTKIINIVNNCGSINAQLYDSAMFLKTYLDAQIEIYPFENLFVHLLDQRKCKEASKFLHLFGNKIENYAIHLNNAYLNETNTNSKLEILSISPEDRTDIESGKISNTTSDEHDTNSSDENIIYDSFDELSVIKEKVRKDPQSNFDKEILTAVYYYSETDLFTFCDTFGKAVTLLKDINTLIDFSLPVFESGISSICVDSNEVEDAAWQILDKISSTFEKKVVSCRSLNEQNASSVSHFMKKISIMKSIVDHSPFHLFECEYEFSNFGNNLSFIFPKLDIVDSLLSYNSIFEIPMIDYELDLYITNCCKLGITDFQIPYEISSSRYKSDSSNDNYYHCQRSLFEGISDLLNSENQFFEPLMISVFINQFPPTDEMVELYPEDKKKKKKPQMPEQSQIKEEKEKEQVVNPVNKSSSISFGLDEQGNSPTRASPGSNSLPSLLLSGNMSNEHFFKRIKMISSQGSSSMFEIEPMRKVKDFFKDNAPIDIVISFYASKGDVTNAIKLLNESEKIYDEKSQQELFKSSFFEKVIARGDDVKVSLKSAVTISKDLLLSIITDSCPYLRFEIFSFMKEWMEAYKAAIDLFCIPQSDIQSASIRSLNLLTIMENCLEKTEEESDEKELSKIVVSLQREVCIFTIDNNIPYNFPETNLFKSNIQRESVVIFLLTHFNIKLAIAIHRFFILSTFRISEKFCDIFVNESPQNVIIFFKKFQKEIDLEMFMKFFYPICLRIKYFINIGMGDVNNATLHLYINAVENKDFKRKLLYQFGFFDEATEHAFAEGDIDMIEMIANDAYLLQKSSLYSKCLKYIEKNSK